MENRGITLVELIIAIAMSSIIIGATTLLIRTAQKDYQYTSDTADIQTETQVLMEQVGKWIMEGNRIKVEDGGKKLSIYKIPQDKAVINTTKKIIWLKSGKLYMESFNNVDIDNDTLTYSAADEKGENCIGEHIEEFKANVDGGTPSSVELTMTLKRGSQKYNIENTINVRNRLR